MKNIMLCIICSIILTGCGCEKEHINTNDISNISTKNVGIRQVIPIPFPSSNIPNLTNDGMSAPILYPSKKVLIDKCHIHCINCKIDSETE